MRFALAIVLSLSLSLGAVGADTPGSSNTNASQQQSARADQAERFAVKVLNETANVFAPEVSRSHGTGFIVELTPERGVVFTNNHVVDVDPLEAQRIRLQFASPVGLPETIPGRVVYRSPLLDFAVVEFDPRKLRRVRGTVAVAAVVEPGDFAAAAKKGTKVMAFGHPLDTSDVSTFGEVSGFHRDSNRGVFLQTTAPINPGNSGGPLLELNDGKVIGMNTAKITSADNTGYAIPIDTILRAYRAWRASARLGRGRNILARLSYHEAGEMQVEGLTRLVRAEDADFFDHHEGMLLVSEADTASNLQVGDLIFKCEGQIIGHHGYVLDEIVLNAGDSVEMLVIRNRQLVKVRVPVVGLGLAQVRQEVDFVMLAGLLLQEHTPDREWAIAGRASRIVVSQVMQLTPAAELGRIVKGSVIIEVQIGGVTYPVKRLGDLKRALARRKDGEPVRVVYHPPVVIPDGDGMRLVSDRQFGGALILRERRVALLPVDQVITPKDLSLRLMKAKFDFSGKAPATRDWRNWIGKKACSLHVAVESGADTDEL